MTQVIIPITSLALLKVNGADAESFLQGQLTTDITQLQANWNFAGYCSPKGRLLAIFKIWQQHNDYYLLLPTELIDSIQKRLTMFVLRSKVTIENITTDIVGIIGSEYQKKIMHQLDMQFADNTTVAYNNAYTAIKIGTQRCLLITSKNWDSKAYEQQAESVWFDADIEDGHGQVFTNTSNLFVPQMMNLDLLKGISFKKGCYTGQEIVARMHYLGKLKQRMYKIQLPTNTKNIEPGAVIQNQDGKNAGNIVSVQNHSNNPVYALAVIRKEYLNQPLTINNTPVQIDETAQPYAVD